MIKFRILSIFIIILFISCPLYSNPDITAEAGIVLSAVNGEIIYQKNIHKKLFPASTTKLMTALVVSEKALLHQEFKVSKFAYFMPPSKAYLSLGKTYTVCSLLHAILMSSSNDAAVVLAEGVAGTQNKFVELMNKKCVEIGALETKFCNASGLPSKEEQYTTVFDLSIIMSAVLNDPVLVNILKKEKKIITGSDNNKKNLITHNKLLRRKDILIIGKTGYTIRAGKCFVGYKFDDNGEGIIFALLKGKKSLWKDILTMLEIKKRL